MDRLQPHGTVPAVAARCHFPQQRHRLPASVISGSWWDGGVVSSILATGNRSAEEIALKRILRNRRLTRGEAARYKDIRQKINKELPDLIDRHHERMTALEQLHDLLMQLKDAREAKGLSLSDLTELTGMDRSALSKLETGQRANPTVETLVRYAQAVGKRLVVKLSDA